jgi:hypothetical protein
VQIWPLLSTSRAPSQIFSPLPQNLPSHRSPTQRAVERPGRDGLMLLHPGSI